MVGLSENPDALRLEEPLWKLRLPLSPHSSDGEVQEWTWGNHDFGYARDRCLTEDDGPYVELMAGVYTDNQPDFSFLAPGETKTFSQFWYPIRGTGVPLAANLNAAIALRVEDGVARVSLCVTRDLPQVRRHGRT